MRKIQNWLALISLLGGSLAAPAFTLSSPAFAPGQAIPAQYTCVGQGQSPSLRFANPPTGTKSFAILGWDDDAKGGLASQWVLYDLPSSTAGIPANIAAGAVGANFKQGQNTYGKLGYSGPCAKDGKRHHIYFDLYALNVPSLDLPAGASLEAVHTQIKKHRIKEAKLLGLVR